MNFKFHFWFGVVVIGLGLFACGCDGPKQQSVSVSESAVACEPTTPTAVATLNGTDITDEDLRKSAGPKITQAEADLYDARKDAADQIIEDRLTAAAAEKSGLSKEDYLRKNVFEKVTIDDKEVKAYYDQNSSQMQGRKLEDIQANLKAYLLRDKQQKLYGDFVAGLKKNAKIAFHIKAPKIQVEEGDNPSIGPKDAPVVIVEFTDYECPFCGRARPVVNQVLKEYKGKVRYVLRDFPLSFHKNSSKAHEAARCAGEQGKLWEMNKTLFENQKALSIEDLRKYAADLKLDKDKFNQCLDSGKYLKAIQANQEYGEKVGVNGTPAFFINGRMISGARPLASFQEIIEEELASQGR
jgi:protein-disulfide isomerase